ncbi:hypothetical protein MKS88_001253 [Plasmodium brasilianum]|uniref:Uncharacterized protein n=1 Tax=Plasmodium brasilianum TaxID=5824 RepID=A0ACB9YDQ6_PLABR|nr:hypothetical protein MKS88_001253 [Plasmodium brasilianum]
MEQKIKLILCIKIAMFIHLYWICLFNNDTRPFSKCLYEKLDPRVKSYARNYRLLTKYKQQNSSCIIGLREDISNNGKCKKKNISNNEKGSKEQKKLSNRDLLNKKQYYTQIIDYNNAMFDGKHFHFEKKWIKKKNYDYFIEKKRRISDIALKKIKFRKYRYGVVMFFLFFILGIGLSVSCQFKSISASDGTNGIDSQILSFLKGILGLENEGHVYILLFAVTFIMLAALIIVAIYKILKNNEKYQKIKLITEAYE